MAKLVGLVAPIFLLAAPASAEIFKCAGKAGLVVYQNFRCELDSLGSAPSTAPTPKMADAKSRAAAPTAVAAVTQSVPSEPRVGMTDEQVKTVWGDPVEIIQDEPPSGRVEVWHYGDGRTVQFDHKRRVLSIGR